MCVASAVLDPLEVGLSLRGAGPSDISLGRCHAPALQASITNDRVNSTRRDDRICSVKGKRTSLPVVCTLEQYMSTPVIQ